MLRVFTTFSGYDSQCMALDNLSKKYDFFDYDLVGWSEIDKSAIKAHNAVYPQWADRNYGDITKIDWEKVPDFDLFTYSSPCITEDSLILTSTGYKEMKDVNVGDVVLTKSGTWHPVIKKFDNGAHSTCFVHAMGLENIHCTLNHKFWVREKSKRWNPDKRVYERVFSEPEFVKAYNLKKDHYMGIPVIEEEKEFYTDDSDFWYIAGLYIGDGCVTNEFNDVIISCSEAKLKKIKKHLSQDKWKFTVTDNGTCKRFRFANKEVHDKLIELFGKHADGKYIPVDVIKLPKNLLKEFYQGYLDSDGSKIGSNIVQFTSINRQLIYSISMIINKLFHRPTGIYKINAEPTTIIEGRTVNQKDWYQLRFRIKESKQDHAFYEDNYIWFPFDKIVEAELEHVYNMEVEEDHSYVLQGCVSCNCQDFSNAGLQRGGEKGSGTRSSLLWECEKAIAIKRPRWAVLENVKALTQDKFMPLFQKWIDTLKTYGYVSHWQIINSKYYGIPQNRERVFLVSQYTGLGFPQARMLSEDALDKECFEQGIVDEKYYISQENVQKALRMTAENNGVKNIEELLPPHLDENKFMKNAATQWIKG